MIRWVFLDVGNVVMNDDPVMGYLYETLHREILASGLELSFDRLLEEREALIRAGGGGHWSVLAERYLGGAAHERLMAETADHLRPRYLEYHNVIPGMREAVAELAEFVSLGVVANQMGVAVPALEASGFRDVFQLHALSELVGASKPDPAIFQWALDEAKCRPEEAIMVGDRIDNDVVPALELGMWTIWFHAPLETKGYEPSPGYRRQYFESQLRCAVSEIAPSSGVTPHGEARSGRELVAEVRRLIAQASSAP